MRQSGRTTVPQSVMIPSLRGDIPFQI